MEKASLRDAAWCEALWHKYADRLLLYATSILEDRSAAEDVLQSVFARLLADVHAPPPEAETSYLFRAIRNEALNALRSRNRASRAYQNLLDLPKDDPRAPAELADLRDRLQGVLMRLPEEEREAVVLRTWGDLSVLEAASVLGVSEKTLEHRYYRGLAAFKEKLGVRDE